MTALSPSSRALLAAPRAAWRRVSKVPFKVLDAPALQDDFYVSLIDWSARDVLAVGLGSDLFLWDAATARVSKLLDTSSGPGAEGVTISAVGWSESGRRLAVATSAGDVGVWDAETSTRELCLERHPLRVGCVAWANSTLATGCRDGTVRLYDVRAGRGAVAALSEHRSEVCGLAFSPDRSTLASGGNDNQVRLWSMAGAARAEAGAGRASLYTLSGHRAAVKALAWSPHKRGILVSGGGTMDKSLRFWSGLTGECVGHVDTGCQVCGVRWSRSVDEVVTSHGYSRNDVVVWRFPSMERVATLRGHKARVLFLAMDPSGETVVTGAGDETLRFWRVFPPMSAAQRDARPERVLPEAPPLAPGAAAAAGTGRRSRVSEPGVAGETCR